LLKNWLNSFRQMLHIVEIDAAIYYLTGEYG
jgi:hypothetical protein